MGGQAKPCPISLGECREAICFEGGSTINRQLTYLDQLDTLLGPLPTRKQINRIQRSPSQLKVNIRVERTLPFEFISNVISPFMQIWGVDETFDLSSYDTSLSSIGSNASADVFILWLDWRLYRDAMTVDVACVWLRERILTLRSKTDKPILINNWPLQFQMEDMLFSVKTGKRKWVRQLNETLSRLSDELSDCWIIDLSYLALEQDGVFFDSRNDSVSHYPFSDQTTILIARHLAVHLLPAVLSPRIKAIALDLDDTLYAGVLGEDGEDGITLNKAHYELQNVLLRLKQSGILLTICSRNEEKDVLRLFNERTDFPLSWNDFAVINANWNSKPENLIDISRKLSIDPSAILFIDDNPAELLKMANHAPTVRLLRADPAGEQTLIKICNYPGLYQLRQDDSASLRTADIQANQAREELKKQTSDYVSYLESLQMIVRLYINEPSHLDRVYELSHKTNQFNLALRRMSKTEVEQIIKKREYMAMTVQLVDTLSDSGIIGTFICRLEQEKATLIEVLFSCRALGREIETLAFASLLKRLMELGIKQLIITVQEGPRNAPAREWLQRFVNDPGIDQTVTDLFAHVSASCSNHPAKVEEII
ncbi:HAD-superfamily phosphatase, subfamily IIIC/FkbH-like domain-containing protein [Paenibacillus sp. yr247]|uniref:HAD-IIIC family phosphatase n=1 Tax=Paenibacillus sp. yr247 TaxID=1761880 RepID=UPI000883B7F6|nr:HAD-IIIC family phosphatase [Paenibacillus sp. yr247]SDO85130.1 HAD-superfamily phosphatase, subfamily IIIC/FkbH-like domain-containing protein [Paenibacillus sp. yr247]